VLFLLGANGAWAVTLDEIPDDVRSRLPDFILQLVDPAALAALSVDDVEEYADAYQRGQLQFVADVRVIEQSGPLTPEQATLLLQIPQGAPFVKSRFVRLAKRAYGQGIFSRLEWEIWENADESVSIDLFYSSRQSQYWFPDISYDSIAGVLYGARYEDYYYGDSNRSLSYGVQLNELDTYEPRIYASWTDNTLNNDHNSYRVSASVASDWRRRMRLTPGDAEFRQRIARTDLTYSWFSALRIDHQPGSITLGTGAYDQDHFVLKRDPTGGGTMPRSDFDQAGTAGYVSVSWFSSHRDVDLHTQEGWYSLARAEQHFGDFPFSRVSFDLRRYLPTSNVLGFAPEEEWPFDKRRHDVRRQFPMASFAIQVQGSLADGDVPYSQEVYLGNANIARGFLYDGYAGTKLLAARGEYRFALDKYARHEAFVFTDHAFLGETLDDMESFSSVGLGAVLEIPIYGGFKLGGYHAWSLDDDEKSYGLSFGYQF